jgi:hypothetical protein
MCKYTFIPDELEEAEWSWNKNSSPTLAKVRRFRYNPELLSGVAKLKAHSDLYTLAESLGGTTPSRATAASSLTDMGAPFVRNRTE